MRVRFLRSASGKTLRRLRSRGGTFISPLYQTGGTSAIGLWVRAAALILCAAERPSPENGRTGCGRLAGCDRFRHSAHASRRSSRSSRCVHRKRGLAEIRKTSLPAGRLRVLDAVSIEKRGGGSLACREENAVWFALGGGVEVPRHDDRPASSQLVDLAAQQSGRFEPRRTPRWSKCVLKYTGRCEPDPCGRGASPN